jgi:hypothetical protein
MRPRLAHSLSYRLALPIMTCVRGVARGRRRPFRVRAHRRVTARPWRCTTQGVRPGIPPGWGAPGRILEKKNHTVAGRRPRDATGPLGVAPQRRRATRPQCGRGSHRRPAQAHRHLRSRLWPSRWYPAQAAQLTVVAANNRRSRHGQSKPVGRLGQGQVQELRRHRPGHRRPRYTTRGTAARDA